MPRRSVSSCDTPTLSWTWASRLGRATCAVSGRTTRLAPGYVEGVCILHHRGKRGMGLNRAVRADREDIGRPHDIPWGHYPTRAAIRAAADTPPTTHGAGLRGIGFVDLHGPTGLVVELRDEASIARLADGLSLAWGHVLRGIIEWIAYISWRTGG